MGCAVGDIDNDGDPDLYLTALGPNFLFRNNGDGTFSDVLGREIRHQDVPPAAWSQRLAQLGVPAHLLGHLDAMVELHREGRYDRMTDDYTKLTGRAPTTMREFVERHAAEFAKA